MHNQGPKTDSMLGAHFHFEERRESGLQQRQEEGQVPSSEAHLPALVFVPIPFADVKNPSRTVDSSSQAGG